ncbi:hypothetical protein [Paraburkholderia jirisanensis]
MATTATVFDLQAYRLERDSCRRISAAEELASELRIEMGADGHMHFEWQIDSYDADRILDVLLLAFVDIRDSEGKRTIVRKREHAQ